MVSLNQAKKLRLGKILYSNVFRNADGTPQRWKVNGKVKTWKTMPGKVKVPIKYGMYDHDYLNENNLDSFSITELGAKRKLGKKRGLRY